MAITVVILFASLAILGWQYVGCGDTIGGALGIDSKLAMLLVGVVVTAYVVFGGIWAATATDLIQFSWVFIIQFIILPIYLIAKYGMPDAAALPQLSECALWHHPCGQVCGSLRHHLPDDASVFAESVSLLGSCGRNPQPEGL